MGMPPSPFALWESLAPPCASVSPSLDGGSWQGVPPPPAAREMLEWRLNRWHVHEGGKGEGAAGGAAKPSLPGPRGWPILPQGRQLLSKRLGLFLTGDLLLLAGGWAGSRVSPVSPSQGAGTPLVPSFSPTVAPSGGSRGPLSAPPTPLMAYDGVGVSGKLIPLRKARTEQAQLKIRWEGNKTTCVRR